MEHDGNGQGFDAYSNSLVSAIQQPNIASELIGQDDEIRKKFLTLSNLRDVNEANDFSFCFHKCDKHGLETKKKLFDYMLNARVSVGGYRSAQIVDILTQIQRIEDSRMEKLDGKRKGVKSPNL